MSNIAYGGKNFYGAAVGILMLETKFPRVHGDIGNAMTWNFPVMMKCVKGASLDLVVNKRADGLLDAFVEAGLDLVAQVPTASPPPAVSCPCTSRNWPISFRFPWPPPPCSRSAW